MIFYEVRTNAGEQKRTYKTKQKNATKILRHFHLSRPSFLTLRHDHGKWLGINKNKKKLKTRSSFDEIENITRRFRRPSFCHRMASRNIRNPTFSTAMRCMGVDGSFHEVIRLKTHVDTCQPRFHAHTRTGWKGDVRERIINLKLGSPNRNTDVTSENWRKSATPTENFWEIGKFRRCRKSKRTISNVQRKR